MAKQTETEQETMTADVRPTQVHPAAEVYAMLPDDELKALTNTSRMIRNREREEVKLHQKWARRERKRGRPALELTWGTCLKENGYWKPSELSAAAK